METEARVGGIVLYSSVKCRDKGIVHRVIVLYSSVKYRDKGIAQYSTGQRGIVLNSTMK